MDTKTLLVVLIDGGLFLFFLYALYYISKRVKKLKEPVNIGRKVEPAEFQVEKYEPTDIPDKPETPSKTTIEKETLEYEPQIPDTSQAEDLTVTEEIKEEIPSIEESTIEEKIKGIDIIEIEGIGPVYSSKLYEIDIYTVSDLLDRGAKPSGRNEIADKTDIRPSLIDEWVSHADLYRIKGVEGQFAELLEAADVESVPDLAMKNPEDLHNRMVQVNEEKNLVRGLPTVNDVQEWVNEAKKLPKKIQY